MESSKNNEKSILNDVTYLIIKEKHILSYYKFSFLQKLDQTCIILDYYVFLV